MPKRIRTGGNHHVTKNNTTTFKLLVPVRETWESQRVTAEEGSMSSKIAQVVLHHGIPMTARTVADDRRLRG
jgi:hypothetical protein